MMVRNAWTTVLVKITSVIAISPCLAVIQVGAAWRRHGLLWITAYIYLAEVEGGLLLM